MDTKERFSANDKPQSQGLPPLPGLILLCLFVVIATWGGIEVTKETERVASVWLPNGAILAFVLFGQSRSQMVYLIGGFAANVIGNIIAGDEIGLSLLLATLNSFEILAAALPLISWIGRAPDLGQLKTFAKFSLFAVVLAPALSALAASELLWLSLDAPRILTLPHWFLADALGMAITTPIFLGFLRQDISQLLTKNRIVTTLLCLLTAVTTMGLVFYQSRYPLLFLIPPVLMATTVSRGFASVVLFMPFLALTALVGTVTGHGPFALAVSASFPEKVILAQLFILVNFLMASFVANIFAERRRAGAILEEEHRRLIESEARFRMLSDNSADMVFRVAKEGIIEYASPSVEEILGYTPDEMIGRTARQFTHPDDLHLRQNLTEKLEREGGLAADRVRALHKDGQVVWLERRMRAIIFGGKRVFISNARDITSGVVAEQRLAEANDRLSELAKLDGLTGIANRRSFDEALASEWRRAQRKGKPVSLLLLDVDCFKYYNDRYGHQAGDQCLLALAQKLAMFAHRPGDLAARYGGEEFVLILPECAEADAARIAEVIRSSVEGLRLPHIDNNFGKGVVTVSIGIATIRPVLDEGKDSNPAGLVHAADKALYEAKRTGRNKVVSWQGVAKAQQALSVQEEERRLAVVGQFVDAAANFCDELNNIAYLAATMLKTPISLVSIVGRDNQIFLGRHGTKDEGTARDVSFCAHTLNGTLPLVVNDATTDPRFANNALVRHVPGIRFYAGAPLITSGDGTHLGALCIIDQAPRPVFDEEQRKLLGILASLAVKCMESKIDGGVRGSRS